MTEHHVMTVPGMSFKALFCQAKPVFLRNILNESIVDVLEALDPEILPEGRFGELVKGCA